MSFSALEPDSPEVAEWVSSVDWDTVNKEVVDILVSLLKINTTNYGREKGCREDLAVAVIADIFKKEGIEYQIVHREGYPQRQNIIARIKGSGKQEPLLLSGHLDVVPADDASGWDHDPFSGVIAKDAGGNECIYGRGAIDMKNMVAMSLMTIILIKRHNIPLGRDVIFAGIADEERGMFFGSRFLVEEHPDLVRAEYLFTEVGGVSYYVKGKKFYMVQVAEKGGMQIDLKVKGTPGHGSMLSDDNAVVKASRVVEAVSVAKFPTHTSPATNAMINTMAKVIGGFGGAVFRRLLNPRFSDTILKAMPAENRYPLYSILHNTHNPTGIFGGETVNQIPASVNCTFDCRFAPGQTKDTALDEFKSVVDKILTPDEYEITAGGNFDLPGNSGNPHDPILPLLGRVMKKHDDTAVLCPSVVPGGTDAKYYAQIGIKCLGYSPLLLPPDIKFSKLYHGNNERIPVDGFIWGNRVLFESVLCVAGLPNES